MMIIIDLNNVHFPSGVFRIIAGETEVLIILSHISNNYFYFPFSNSLEICVCFHFMQALH